MVMQVELHYHPYEIECQRQVNLIKKDIEDIKKGHEFSPHQKRSVEPLLSSSYSDGRV